MTRDWIIGCLDNAARSDPAPRGFTMPADDCTAANLIPAAVLVPLIERPKGMTVMLTRRTPHLAAHAGQISFPGGRIEASDADAAAAALREAAEEVGLGSADVEVLGKLDVYNTRTGYEVAPFVGWVAPGFVPCPCAHEVDEVFEVPLDFLLDPANCERHCRQDGDRERHFYAFPYGRHFIWGATAGILVNLREVLAKR